MIKIDQKTGAEITLARPTYVCNKCKEKTNVEDIIVSNKIKFCTKCMEAKGDYDKTANYIIKLFGLKCMGPLMNSQRTQLIKKGMDDDEIVRVLKYIYEIKNKPRTVESMYFVGQYREEAAAYYQKKDYYIDNIKSNLSSMEDDKVSYIHIYDNEEETSDVDEASFFQSLNK